MRTITILAGWVALVFTIGMVVLFGHTTIVPIKHKLVPVDNRNVLPPTKTHSTDKTVRQSDKHLELYSIVKTLDHEEQIEKINAKTNHSSPSKVISNSTLKIYRIQEELPDVSNDTHAMVTGHEVPLRPLTNTTAKSYSYPCPAPEVGKPNPSLTQCLLEAIHAIPDKAFPDDLRIFNPTFSIDIHMELLELLEVFHQEMTSHNLTHFLHGGTLLGSWRHHGFIPWDDDADVFMDVQDQPRLKKALSKLPTRYGRFTQDGAMRWKLYISKRHQFENQTNNWAFPFLDICFYEKTKTHIQDIDRVVFSNSRVEIDSVFPVILRPFYHLMLPSPRDTAKYLNQEFALKQNRCIPPWWDHRKRKHIHSVASGVSCRKLYPFFPFVKLAGSMEILTTNEGVLYHMMETKY